MSSSIHGCADIERACVEISVKGRHRNYPAVHIDGNTIFVSGRWPKIARIRDEEWLDRQAVTDPVMTVRALKEADLGAHLFTFAQKVPNLEVSFAYRSTRESVAVACTRDYE